LTEPDDEDGSRLTAAAAYLLQGEYKCDSCGRPTKVFTIMVAGPLKIEGDVYGSEEEFSCVLRRLETLPEPVARAARDVSEDRFRLDHSRMAGESYLMNHCQHCEAKVGDWFIHNPGEAFFPTHPDDIARVTGQRFEGPFVFGKPDTSWSGWTNEWLEANGVSVPRSSPPPPRKPRAKRATKS
jgi:hypothetical protein